MALGWHRFRLESQSKGTLPADLKAPLAQTDLRVVYHPHSLRRVIKTSMPQQATLKLPRSAALELGSCASSGRAWQL